MQELWTKFIHVFEFSTLLFLNCYHIARRSNKTCRIFKISYLDPFSTNNTSIGKISGLPKINLFLSKFTPKSLQIYQWLLLEIIHIKGSKSYYTFYIRAPDKVCIFISIKPISSPNPMLDHLLESSHRDDSNKCQT